MRTIVAFVVGVIVGGVAAYSLLERRPSGVGSVPASAAPPLAAAGPPSTALALPSVAATVPAPAPDAAAFATPLPEGLAPLGGASPSPVPGDSTDHLMDPRAFAPPPGVTPDHIPDVSDFGRLRSRNLRVPLDGYDLRGLRDNFAEKRGARVHEAIDILAPRGTPVLAVDDGVVKKLFTSGAGGLTVYQYDPSQDFCYYYAHLDRYADGLAEGKALKKGDRIGYVGTTGNAPPNTPHLHFTIFKLGAEKRWWEGTPINPYPLWAAR